MTDITEDELLPCPFCGGEAHFVFRDMDAVAVRCKVWGADTCLGASAWHLSKEQAAAQWNKRQRERQAVAVPETEAKRQRDDSVDLLLRAVFEVCEATESIDPKNDFERGRVFEAKGIRRGIGTWFQGTFCGRSFMGEPAMLSAAPPADTVKQDPNGA